MRHSIKTLAAVYLDGTASGVIPTDVPIEEMSMAHITDMLDAWSQRGDWTLHSVGFNAEGFPASFVLVNEDLPDKKPTRVRGSVMTH